MTVINLFLVFVFRYGMMNSSFNAWALALTSDSCFVALSASLVASQGTVYSLSLMPMWFVFDY